jgi:MFS family permease
MYFQLKNLDSSLSSGQIVTQSATVSTAYIIGQCLSSIWISVLADSPKCGRKKVLLLGTAASSKLALRGEDSHCLTSILTVGCVSSHKFFTPRAHQSLLSTCSSMGSGRYFQWKRSDGQNCNN